jgi:hypothetical protein
VADDDFLLAAGLPSRERLRAMPEPEFTRFEKAFEEHMHALMHGDGTAQPLGLINTEPAKPTRPFSLTAVQNMERELAKSMESIVAKVVVHSEREVALVKLLCPPPPPTIHPLTLLGYALETDPTMPPRTIEFRNRDGKVLARVEDFA